MVSVAVANNHRHALKLLKKKYRVKKMNDVIGILLHEYEANAYDAGTNLADMEEAQEQIFSEGKEDE